MNWEINIYVTEALEGEVLRRDSSNLDVGVKKCLQDQNNVKEK